MSVESQARRIFNDPRSQIMRLQNEVAELRRENAALRAEKEILDWLEAHAISIWVPHGDDQFAIILPTREAIQQARKEGQS